MDDLLLQNFMHERVGLFLLRMVLAKLSYPAGKIVFSCFVCLMKQKLNSDGVIIDPNVLTIVSKMITQGSVKA